MPDWTKAMSQTFEYYEVDPITWADSKRINLIKSSSISRDFESETLGSATFDVDEMMGESYIRTYLITVQNGIKEKFPLGTHLVQTPSTSYDGKIRSVSLDAYTPLIELKEKLPPFGYCVQKNDNIMQNVCRLIKENCRAPVISTESDKTLYRHFIAGTDDTWLSFNVGLMEGTDLNLNLDEMGRIIFSPKYKLDAMTPIWTYNDDNSSILSPKITFNHDIFGIPNVLEVIYSDQTHLLYSKAVNDDAESVLSTKTRGRTIEKRILNPDLGGVPNQALLDEYTNNALKELSTVAYTVSYTHGYCPVRVGDCVRLNYTQAGLENVKAKVISQTINCQTGCNVSETAIFTTKLWR